LVIAAVQTVRDNGIKLNIFQGNAQRKLYKICALIWIHTLANNERTSKTMGTAAVWSLRSVVGYRMMDQKHNAVTREQLGMTRINAIKNCCKKCLEHLERSCSLNMN
jgi:hypothetical protein